MSDGPPDDPAAPATLAESQGFVDVLSDRIDGLSQVVRGVIAAYHQDTAAQFAVATAYRESAAATKEALRRRTRLEWTVYITLAVVLLGMVAVGLGTWQAYKVGQAIESCTTPTGKCAQPQRQREQTDPVVQRIINGQGVAGWCGAHTRTPEASVACVARYTAP